MGAGLGFKTFVTGDVLTAADTNGYLMQGVWVFASAAARDAAVTSPQEGNFCYLKDTNVTQFYTGSAWSSVGASGLTLVKSGTITTAADSSTTFDGVFTATYRNYLVLMTDLLTSTNQDLRLQTRTGGVTASGGVYYGSRTVLGSSGAAVNTQTAGGTSTPIVIMQPGGTGVSNMQLWFSSVGVAQRPTWNGTGYDITVSGSVTEGYSSSTASAIDGFILSVASGTFSGLIKVYGVQN